MEERERKLQYWYNTVTWYSCHASDSVHECNQLLRTLLLWGEMDPLFRLASHPQIFFSRMWRFPEDGTWVEVKDIALMAYLCLNMFYVKSELWDGCNRKKKLEETKQKRLSATPEGPLDYRLTSSYQHMLLESTGEGRRNYDCAKHPHREFFGVPRGMYTSDLN